MARTKASVGSKVSSFKSSKARCSVAPTASNHRSSGSDHSSRNSSGGGNPVCQRETPKWQKPITNFFISHEGNSKIEDDAAETEAGSSKPKVKNTLEKSDDEKTETSTDTILDESIELQPLNGENSHKIEEYYNSGGKGKGIGKKSVGKENRRVSKRNREDYEESVSKKVRFNE